MDKLREDWGSTSSDTITIMDNMRDLMVTDLMEDLPLPLIAYKDPVTKDYVVRK